MSGDFRIDGMQPTQHLGRASDSVLQFALNELLCAAECAAELGRSVWDFAVELEWLGNQGLTPTAVRRLIFEGFVEHAHETTSVGECRRRFLHKVGLVLSSRSVLVLTEAGVRRCRAHTQLNADSVGRISSEPPASANKAGEPPAVPIASHDHLVAPSSSHDLPIVHTSTPIHHLGAPLSPQDRLAAATPAIPVWDEACGELTFRGLLIKRFRVPAPNQSAILSSFQEEGWPHRIDDPLPPVPDVEPKIRLRDTVKCLNRSRETAKIHFTGDGRGTGVVWREASA